MVAVKTFTYLSSSEKKSQVALVQRPEVSRGQIEIDLHPDYRGEFDAESRLVESRADIAAIHLTQPILGVPIGFQVPPAREAEVGDVLVTVGYGMTQPEGGRGTIGQRYYGSNMVRLVSSWADPGDRDGRVKNGLLVFQGEGPDGQETHILEGDSGGPCFAQRKDGVWLVGITSVSGEPSPGTFRSSIFTSTFVYREWINQQKVKSGQRIKKLTSKSN